MARRASSKASANLVNRVVAAADAKAGIKRSEQSREPKRGLSQQVADELAAGGKKGMEGALDEGGPGDLSQYLGSISSDTSGNAPQPGATADYQPIDRDEPAVEPEQTFEEPHSTLDPEPAPRRAEPNDEQEREVDSSDSNTWPDWLLREAVNHGLKAKNYSSPEALGEAIVQMADLRVSMGQPQRHEPAPQQHEPAHQEPEAFDPYDGKRETYTDETTAIVDRQTKHYQAELAKRDERLGNLERAHQEQQSQVQAQRNREIDRIFIKLNEQFDGAFGMLPASRMTADSPEARNRTKVLKIVGDMLDDGDDFTPENFAAAAAFVFKKTPVQVADDVREQARQVDPRLQRRQANFVGTPTQRRRPAAPARDEGLNRVKAWLGGQYSQGNGALT